MIVNLHGIGLTPFRAQPLVQTIQRFGRGIERAIVLQFVERLDGFASHTYEARPGVHIIKVHGHRHWWIDGSPRLDYGTKEMVAPLTRLTDGEARIHFLASILHELRHAWQYENWGHVAYHYPKRHPELSSARMRYQYSPEEVDARVAEAKAVAAMEFYESCPSDC